MKLLLFTFLSVIAFFTSSLFAQTKLKKEQGLCGKTMSAVLKTDPQADNHLISIFKLDDEFCDYGRYEENANFIIYLYDDKDRLVYDKYVYLNPFTIHESTDPKKNPGKIKLQKIEKGTASRIVKFPLAPQLGNVKSYQIESLAEKKVSKRFAITWTAP